MTWLLSVVLLFLPQVVAVFYYLHRHPGGQPTVEALLADKTSVILLVSGILPVHLLTLGIAWAVATQFGKIPAREALKWQWGSRLSILKIVGLATGLFALAFLATLAFGGTETELEKLVKSSRTAALMIAFLAVATAPLVEEIIYRGILFPAWQRLTGSPIAVIIVTLFFALPHVPQYWGNLAVISSITILSLVLTTVRARTGRLLPCYIIHLVFNGIQSILIVAETLIGSSSEVSKPDAAASMISSLLGIL